MLTKRLTIVLGCLLLTTFCRAQDTLLLRDYQFVKRNSPWLTSTNAAALVCYDSENIAEAELSLTRRKGGFVDFYDSPDAWEAGARVESFHRISPKTVFYGSMSYQSLSGKDMGSSVFIPLNSHRPFDIVEDSLTNTGDKHLDIYHLTGGVGSTICKGIALGACLDYTAANYAKYKDLRHQNKLMDLRASAGIYLPLTRWAAVGAHYVYRRNTESVAFGTYGTSDKVYKSLVDYAVFMGHVEQYGNEGYTDKSREMPLTNDYHGAGIQFSLKIDSLTNFYNAFEYQHRTGYYGRKSPYTITYTDHRANLYHYDARFTHQDGSTRFSVDFSFDMENLQNDANTFRELQNSSSATYYEYYMPVKTANKLWKNYTLAYTFDFGMRKEYSQWTLQAGIHRSERQQTAYLFPYYRSQKLSNCEVFASLTRNLACRYGVWTLSLNGSFLKGEGKPYEDKTYQLPSDKQVAPPTMEAYLMREYQYLTASQYSIGGQLKYAFVIPSTHVKAYIRTALNHRKAQESYEYSNGQNRTQATLAIGCDF